MSGATQNPRDPNQRKPEGSFTQGSQFRRGESGRLVTRSQGGAYTSQGSSQGYASANPRQAHARANGQRPSAAHARANTRPSAQRARRGSRQSGYAQRPQLEQPIITNRAEGYQTRAPHQRPARKRSKVPVVVGILAAVAILVGVVYFLWATFGVMNVTVNGVELTLKPGTTVEGVVEEGHASPTPGNLLAIDGSLLEQGAGQPFTATVDGEAADGQTVLKNGNVVQISDGGDTTEETTTEEVSIPFGTSSSDTWGAIHVYSQGTDGVMQRVTGTRSGIVQETVLQAPVDAGYVQYNADTGDDKVVALTFDDGPWDTTTQQILDILKENGAVATFFTIGNQIAGHEDLVKEAVANGNEVCTHTWDHADGSGQGVNLTYMSPEEQINEVEKGRQAITDATGQEAPTVIRSPGGNFYGDTIQILEPYVTAEINWNIDTEDWKRPGVDAIVAQIESAQPGDIILMHDGGGDRSQTVEALSIALPYLKEQGFSFVTIDQLLQYPIPSVQE